MNYDNVLNGRIKAVPPSGIRKFFDIVSEMQDVISLGVGEPDFTTPWRYSDAAIYSLRQGRTHYTSNRGLKDLCRLIARYERRFGAEYDPASEIMVTVGASEGIDLALRSVVDAGDEVLVPDPSYVSYMPCVTFAGGKCVPVPTGAENGFILTPELIKPYITPRTKALILPYPNNPTGGIMGREELEAVAEVLQGTDIMVLSDEIYAELTYGRHHVSPANLPDLYERTIVVNGFSKAYSMTGWRLGYLCGPKEIIGQAIKLHQYGIMSAPTNSQYAAIEALNEGDNDIAVMREDYDGRRRYLLAGFRRLGLDCFEAEGAFYLFPCIRSTGLTSDEFCARFLQEQRVAVIPGSAFGPGGEGFVRACYAASMHDLSEALHRLEQFLADLKK